MLAGGGSPAAGSVILPLRWSVVPGMWLRLRCGAFGMVMMWQLEKHCSVFCWEEMSGFSWFMACSPVRFTSRRWIPLMDIPITLFPGAVER